MDLKHVQNVYLVMLLIKGNVNYVILFARNAQVSIRISVLTAMMASFSMVVLALLALKIVSSVKINFFVLLVSLASILKMECALYVKMIIVFSARLKRNALYVLQEMPLLLVHVSLV